VSTRLHLRSALDPDAQEDLRLLKRPVGSVLQQCRDDALFCPGRLDQRILGRRSEAPSHHLLAAIPNGATVLDVGCGSAPIADHLARRNIRFTGVDGRARRSTRNTSRKPDAEFVAGSLYDIDFGGRQFDVVTNLYVIEHAVWPHRLLDSLYRPGQAWRPDRDSYAAVSARDLLKSFDYGLSAIPFKDKVRRLKWIDAALHAYQHRVVVPGVLRREYPRGTPRAGF
jgi:ubiquinone/menaquinone biosynthesis C-methylase UbiE